MLAEYEGGLRPAVYCIMAVDRKMDKRKFRNSFAFYLWYFLCYFFCLILNEIRSSELFSVGLRNHLPMIIIYLFTFSIIKVWFIIVSTYTSRLIINDTTCYPFQWTTSDNTQANLLTSARSVLNPSLAKSTWRITSGNTPGNRLTDAPTAQNPSPGKNILIITWGKRHW